MLDRSQLNLALLLTLTVGVLALYSQSLGLTSHSPSMDIAAVHSATLVTPMTPAEVVIENFAFQPSTLTVKAGTKVTWVNKDDDPHTATASDKSFNSKTLDTGDRFTTEFNTPGTYSYYCALHPRMTGQVIVK